MLKHRNRLALLHRLIAFQAYRIAGVAFLRAGRIDCAGQLRFSMLAGTAGQNQC